MAYAEEIEMKVALSMTKGVTSDFLRSLEESGLDWHDLFQRGELARKSSACGLNLSAIEPMGLEEALFNARKEVEFLKQHFISAIFYHDDDYPDSLRRMPDAPVALYKLGSGDIGATRMVSIVGTRHATPRGVAMTTEMVRRFADMYPGLTIVSGLAYGIDAAAHNAALECGLPTLAVLAHGLHMIYPAAHRDLARRIISSGGALISEYPSGTQPYRGRFLERNRIVAGLSSATIVMESGVKGGAMSTARCADEYNRDVMAVPGRPSDPQSAGCNALIKRHRASLICDAEDFASVTGWRPETVLKSEMPTLFPELEGDNRRVYDALLAADKPLTMDEILYATKLQVSMLMQILSELEFDSVIVRHPGNRFSLLR